MEGMLPLPDDETGVVESHDEDRFERLKLFSEAECSIRASGLERVRSARDRR